MAKKEDKSLAIPEDILATLRESYPVEQGVSKMFLPRISYSSQDVTKETGQGKNKKIELVTAAGTFFTEVQTDDEDENGKKIWDKTEIGDSFEGIILYKRKQLRLYDEATEQYTSSPIYDTDDEVIPLFCDKAEIARGTPADLKARYQYKDEKTGKVRSKLEDNKILYVLKDGTIYQLGLRGSSMYSFMTYDRKVFVPSVLTKFSSEPMQKGTISWNKMTFEASRKLDLDEIKDISDKVSTIRAAISSEKAQYGQVREVTAEFKEAGFTS